MNNNKEINFTDIEQSILQTSTLVKEIAVFDYENHLFALIYPDFQEAKERKIIHLENEIKWYAVELYNIKAKNDYKITNYQIVQHPLPKNNKGKIEKSKLELFMEEQKVLVLDAKEEAKDKVYQGIKSFLSTLTRVPITPSSHLEFDLHLDSLNYVELFTFIEQSFSVHISESAFSQMMLMEELYHYVNEKKKIIRNVDVNWNMILHENIEYKPITSTWYPKLYQTLFLPLFKLYFSLKIENPEKIPQKPCIIAPNHQSMLDGFIMAAALPKNTLEKTFFLAFEMVFGTKIMRPIIQKTQAILIDYNENLKVSMQKNAVVLNKGYNLLIFPEGARTRDRKLLEFKKFFAILSIELNIPIVPVVLDGTFEALPSGKLFPRPSPVIIKYLDPIYPNGLSYEALTQKVKDAINAEMIKNPLY